MRFYLDLPLVLGYTLMATSACLGMLQIAAARGSYRGLSLFAANRKAGMCIGVGLALGSMIAYVLFAPEILTPGPAGTEVAAMFAVCALAALGLTLAGADLKLRRADVQSKSNGKRLQVNNVPATLYHPSPPHPDGPTVNIDRVPVVVLIPDPAGFFVTPLSIVQELCDAGLAVLVLETRDLDQGDELLTHRTLSELVSAAISTIKTQPSVNGKRSGLLAVGWAADLALYAEAENTSVNATMAVSPVAWAPLKPGMTAPGLGWLRELSYRQVWRWRRHGAALIYAAQDMALNAHSKSSRLLGNRAGIGAPILTTRKPGLTEPLRVTSQKYFALLDDKAIRQLVVRWFREVLAGNN